MTVTIIAEFGSSPMPAWDMALWCMEARIAGAGADAFDSGRRAPGAR